jgi:hypothetical protein
VTHHWGARVDGWFASVDETIGTELAFIQNRSSQGNPQYCCFHAGCCICWGPNGVVVSVIRIHLTGYCSKADVCVLCLGTSSINGHSANDPKGRFSMWSPIQEVRQCIC